MKNSPLGGVLQLVTILLLIAAPTFAAQMALDVNPSTIKPRGKIHAALTVSNPGTAELSNVELRLRYPDHLDVLNTVHINKGSSSNTVACTGTYATNCVSGDTVIWNLGSIPPQTGITVDMLPTVFYNTVDNTPIEFEAELWVDGQSMETASKTVTVQAQPFFEITVDQTSVIPTKVNGETEYRIQYSLTGTNSSNTQLTFPLPNGSTYVSSTNGGTHSNGIVTWQLGNMETGETGQQKITFIANGNAGELLEVAPVTIQGNDLNYTVHQEQAAKTSWLESIEAPKFALTVHPDPVQSFMPSFEELHVDLTVSNPSSTPLTDVEIHLRYPDHLDDTSTQFITTGGLLNTVICPGGYATTCEPGEVVVWSIDTIPAESGITVDIRPFIIGTEGNLIQFEAELWVNGKQTLATSRTVAVQDDPFFKLSVDAKATPVSATGETEYRIKYSNMSSISSNTQLSFPLPENSTFISATHGGTLSNGFITWQLGSLQKGDSGEQRITTATNSSAGELVVADPITISGTDSGSSVHQVRATTLGWFEDIADPGFSLALSRDTVRSNEQFRMALTVTNPDQDPLLDVKIRLRLPYRLTPPATWTITSGSDLGTATLSYNSDHVNGTILLDLGTIPPESGITVDMLPWVNITAGVVPDGTLMQIDAELLVADEQISSTSRTITVQAQPFFELSVDQTVTPTATIGETEYWITYSNMSSDSSNLKLTFPLPDGSSFVSATNSGTFSNGVVTWHLNDMQNGETGEQRVTIATNGQEGELLLADKVTISGTDSNNFLHEVKATKEGWLEDIDTAELALTINPDTVRPNEELHIAMTVSNPDAASLSNVELHLRYPAQLYETGSFTTGGSANTTSCASYSILGGIYADLPCDQISPGDIFIWKLGNISPESGVTVDMLSRVRSVDDGTLIPFYAELWVNGRQMMTTSRTVTVQAQPAFELSIDKDVNPAETSDDIEYTINYSAVGTDSSQTKLAFTLPEDTHFARATDGGVIIGDQVTWNLGTIESGQGGEVKITTYENDGAGSSQLIEPVTITGKDSNSTQNTVQASTFSFFNNNSRPDVQFSISPTPVLPNKALDVSLTVANNENSNFSNVELLLLYPEHLSLIGVDQITTGGSSSVSCGRLSTCGSYGTVIWDIGTLVPGQNVTVSIPPMVEYNTPHGTMIPFHAELRVAGRQVTKLTQTVMVGSTFQLAGEYPPKICGDVNADNDAGLKDLILILQSLAGNDVSLSQIGDCNGDKKINMVEAFEILQLLK